MPLIPELSKIKELRRKLNLTQKDLEMALDIPQATLSRIENGKGNPSYLTVKLIFDFLEKRSLKEKNSQYYAKDIMTSEIITISSSSKIKDAIKSMNEFKISQLPIIENGQNLGSITSRNIQKTITDNPEMVDANIDIIKKLPFPEVEINWSLSIVSNLLFTYPAVLVKDRNMYRGIITDADFLKLAFENK